MQLNVFHTREEIQKQVRPKKAQLRPQNNELFMITDITFIELYLLG